MLKHHVVFPVVALLLPLVFTMGAFKAHALEQRLPETSSRLETGGVSRATATQSSPASPSIQRQIPVAGKKMGYCCVKGSVEKNLDQQSCSRKRGVFFTDQRKAQQACDKQQGYCCKDASLTRSSQGNCKRKKGEFFLQQVEGKRKCNATRGYCCSKGKVISNSKGTCEQQKGGFFLNKQEAEAVCAKTEGYCCSKGTVSATTQGRCNRQRGSFFLRKDGAERTCARQMGYCCLDGTVQKVNQGRCQQQKGQFFSSQSQAEQSCRNQKGFCCAHGKVTSSSRNSCEQMQGVFSLHRTPLANTCSARGEGVSSSRATTTGAGTLPSVTKKPEDEKKKTDALAVLAAGNQPTRKDISGYQSASNNSLAKVTAIGGSASQVAPRKGSATTRSSGTVTDQEGLYASKFTIMDPAPVQVVFIQDRMVRLGAKQNKSGLGSDLALKVRPYVPCTMGENKVPQQVSINIKNGYAHPAMASQLGGSFSKVFESFPLYNKNDFIGQFCRPGKMQVSVDAPVEIEVEKSCRMADGSLISRKDSISKTISVICDMRPDADPATYTAGNPSYNFGAIAKISAMRTPEAVQGKQQLSSQQEKPTADLAVGAASPGATAVGGSAEVSLMMQHSTAVVVDDQLRLGNLYQAASAASPVEEVRSSLEVDLQCPIGNPWAEIMPQTGSSSVKAIEVSGGGHHLLQNVLLMTKEQFLEERCADGTFMQDIGRPIKFVIHYGCTDDRTVNYLEKTVHAPMRILTCDRRGGRKATLAGTTPYIHTCPQGFGIKGLPGNPPMAESTSQGSEQPMTCIELKE